MYFIFNPGEVALVELGMLGFGQIIPRYSFTRVRRVSPC